MDEKVVFPGGDGCVYCKNCDSTWNKYEDNDDSLITTLEVLFKENDDGDNGGGTNNNITIP